MSRLALRQAAAARGHIGDSARPAYQRALGTLARSQMSDATPGAGFSVRRGEIFGVLGRNGAGKTTTVEFISGLRT